MDSTTNGLTHSDLKNNLRSKQNLKLLERTQIVTSLLDITRTFDTSPF